MKRIVVLFLTILFLTSAVYAANQQTVYTSRDEVYQRVVELCRRSGVTGPSSFAPLPARALLISLDRIDEESLNEYDRKEFDYLTDILCGEEKILFVEDYFKFDLNAGVNLGFNVAGFSDYNFFSSEYISDRTEDILIPYRYEKPLLSLGVDVDFSDYVALEARVDIKNNHKRLYWSSFNGILSGISADWPQQAGGSFGNKFFNLILGRYPHSIGSGKTGNLLIGDNFNYQEVLLASLMSNHFTYNISITRFDQMDQVQTVGNGYIGDFSRHKFDGDQQFRVLHRFDLTLFDKVRFALNLATIYTSQYGFDIRFFYPFVISHNYYNYANQTYLDEIDEANNLMSIEFEWTIMKGLEFTAQLAVDQMQMPWEDNASVPLAFGALANLKYSTVLSDGRFNAWIETVYTNPYMYLNGKYDKSNGAITGKSYNLDYIVGYNSQYIDDFGYSGYVYGPDSIVFSVGGNYVNDELRYSIGGSILYRVQGDKGLSYRVENTNSTWIDMSDAVVEQSSDEFMDNFWAPSGGWKSAEHMLKISIYGSYELPEYKWGTISFNAGLGGACYFNFNHCAGKTDFRPQLTFGLGWRY